MRRGVERFVIGGLRAPAGARPAGRMRRLQRGRWRGAASLNWFVAIQPGGSIEEIAKACTEQSGGKYEINLELLPTEADQQREQLVRRLGAEDPSIDLIGMDVIWTAEFANAGWLREYEGADATAVTADAFDSVVESASFDGKVYGAPVQLQHRADVLPQGPGADRARDLGRDDRPGPEPPKSTIQLQADRYEGFVVWVNSLIESAGGQILSGPGGGRPARGAHEPGARDHRQARELARRQPRHRHLHRGHRPPRLRGRDLRLPDQLHVRLRQRRRERPRHPEEHGDRPLPGREPG